MTDIATRPAALPLSRLYAVRFVFALVWAGLVLLTGPDLDVVTRTLLVLYPAFDVVAIAADAWTGRTERSLLRSNLAASAAALIGVAFAATSGAPAVLRVFGAWAIVSGISQLLVGRARFGRGGQVPMILSGAISTLAGIAFVVQAAGDAPSIDALAGYAVLGGVFFAISAARRPR